MTPPKKNGAKALSMSQQNAAAIKGLHKLVAEHAKDEAEVWGAVRSQVADIHAAMFGSEKDPDRRGFNERIRDIEDYIGGVKKTVWLAVAAFVSSIFALVVALARSAAEGGSMK